MNVLDRGVAGVLALTSDNTASQIKDVFTTAIVSPTTANQKAAQYLLEDSANNILNGNVNLRANSDTFYAISSNSLKKAVADADSGKNRVIFIDPRFERKNSYGASDSLLWELEGFKTNDNRYEERSELAKKVYPLEPIKQAENIINPIAHPNRDGAAKYAESIKSFLDTPKRLDWLQSGPIANSGASITQDSITEPPSDIPTPTENSDIASGSEPSSDTSNSPENGDTPNTKTKTAYTHDGISYISKERVEENIKAGVAKPSDYEEVQVPLDTFVIGGWKE